jgi:hypothetical protein
MNIDVGYMVRGSTDMGEPLAWDRYRRDGT